MSQRPIHQCQCEICQSPQPHADKEDHHRMNVLLSRLNEQHRRWYVALEARAWRQRTAGADYRSSTRFRGRRELNDDLAGRPTDRVRKPGGGRPALEVHQNQGNRQRRHRTDNEKWLKLARLHLGCAHRHTGVRPQSVLLSWALAWSPTARA